MAEKRGVSGWCVGFGWETNIAQNLVIWGLIVAQHRQRLIGYDRRFLPLARGHRNHAVHEERQRNRRRASDAPGQCIRLDGELFAEPCACSIRGADSRLNRHRTGHTERFAGIERQEQRDRPRDRHRGVHAALSLFLSDSDFWRACNSLQLDETVAIYTSKLMGDPSYVILVNNKHPLVPMSTLQAGYRLLLHGLAAECLHATLVQFKRRQESDIDSRR